MQAHIFDTKKRADDFANKKNKTARKFHWIVVKGQHGGYIAYGQAKR